MINPDNYLKDVRNMIKKYFKERYSYNSVIIINKTKKKQKKFKRKRSKTN